MKEATVDTVSAAHEAMKPRIKKVETLMGGTEAMRAAGKVFLPQYDAETSVNYENRLARATLFNGFRDTVEKLIGRVFTKPLTVSEDAPGAIAALVDNIDLRGNNLDVFAQKLFKSAFIKGWAGVLVDFPQMPEQATLADEQALNGRPYFSLVQPENVVAANYSNIQGVSVLTHLRILEQVTEARGFSEVTISRIRVFERGVFQVWLLVDKEWKIETDWTPMSITQIPFVPFYAGEWEADLVARSPLMDLADLNIEHWQSAADQKNILTVARFPLLASAGIPEEERANIAIGPRTLLGSSDKDAKFYYVEHSGKAIEAGRLDLKELELKMDSLGGQMLIPRPAATATGELLRKSAGANKLQLIAAAAKDALEQALVFAALWLGEPEAGGIQFNTDFDSMMKVAGDTDALFKARALGDIGQRDLLVELKRRDVLGETFDIEQAVELAEED